MPRGGVLARFYRPGGGILNSFLPGGGESSHQKNCPGKGWSGLELTDTLSVIENYIMGGNMIED